jgi:hypothetical protein
MNETNDAAQTGGYFTSDWTASRDDTSTVVTLASNPAFIRVSAAAVAFSKWRSASRRCLPTPTRGAIAWPIWPGPITTSTSLVGSMALARVIEANATPNASFLAEPLPRFRCLVPAKLKDIKCTKWYTFLRTTYILFIIDRSFELASVTERRDRAPACRSSASCTDLFKPRPVQDAMCQRNIG